MAQVGGRHYVGLQVGVGIRPGDKRTYETGQPIQVILNVCNSATEDRAISYSAVNAYTHLAVTDVQDKPLEVASVKYPAYGKAAPIPSPSVQRSLRPGEGVELTSFHLVFETSEMAAARLKNSLNPYQTPANPTVVAKPDKYKIGMPSVHLNAGPKFSAPIRG